MTSRDQLWIEKQAAVLEMVRPEIPLDVYYNLLVIYNSPNFIERAYAEQDLMTTVFNQVEEPQ